MQKMKIGTTYQVAWKTETRTNWLNRVKCIKEMPKSYRVESETGNISLIMKNKILSVREWNFER